MVRYRSFTDKQSLAHLLVLQTFTDQRDDLAFPVGERFNLCDFGIDLSGFVDLLDHAAHHRSFNPNLAFVNLHDRFEKLIGGVLFQHDTHRAASYRAPVRIRVLHSSQYQHSRTPTCLAEFRQKRESIFITKHEIKNNHIRTFAGGTFERFNSVTRLGHYLHALIVLNQHAQTTADYDMVVNYHDGDRPGVHNSAPKTKEVFLH